MSHPMTVEPFCSMLYAKGDGFGEPSVHDARVETLSLMRNDGRGCGKSPGAGNGAFYKRVALLARPGDDIAATLINTLCRMQP